VLATRTHSPFPRSPLRKVKLEVESLAVESFGTCAAPADGGTVVAHGDRSADCSVVCTYEWDCTR
jgi:hypothetical protein